MTQSTYEFGPAYPLPLGVAYISSGDPIASGGANFTYTIPNLSSYANIGWGQGLPSASMNGNPDAPALTFSSSSGMTATWTGTTTITSTGPTGYSGTVYIKLVATIVSGASGWSAEPWSAAAGDPAVVALITSGTFEVNLQWLASTTQNGVYTDAADFFNSNFGPTGQLLTNTDGEFAGNLNPVTVAQYLANISSLDAMPSGFGIADLAANVAGELDTLNADGNVSAITLTDVGTPLLTLTVAQTLGDTTALGEISNFYRIAIVDSATNVAANNSAITAAIAGGHIASVTQTGITGQAYSSYGLSYSVGGNLIGSQFDYTNITGQIYTAFENDFNGGGQITRTAFTGVTGQPFSSYEYDYVGGLLSGLKYTYTTVPMGAAYSSYVVDYNYASAFAGVQYFYTNITGQTYTGEEVDVDSSGNLSRILLTGEQGQGYAAVELDYAAGAFDGVKYFYTGVIGQAYSAEEVDVSATNQLEKVIYSGFTSTPYSSAEFDYTGGAVSAKIFNFTNVTGQAYYADQVTQTPAGANLQQTLDLNNGGHDIFAFVGGQTLTSLGDDLMVGSATGATTFVFNAIYGADTIANYATSDIISMPSSEFTTPGQVISAAANVGGNVVITAPDHDTLTINNTTVAALTANNPFIIHG